MFFTNPCDLIFMPLNVTQKVFKAHLKVSRFQFFIAITYSYACQDFGTSPALVISKRTAQKAYLLRWTCKMQGTRNVRMGFFMKTQFVEKNKSLVVLSGVLLSLIFSSCAKDSSSDASSTTATAANTTTATSPSVPGSSSSSGATVSLSVGITALRGMFPPTSKYPNAVSNPQNIQMNISTANSGSGYAGTVVVSFIDNGNGGALRSANLSTNHPYYGTTSNASYNNWVTVGTQTVWHGFFQDAFGAVIVVIDNAIGLGDGSSSTVSGSVWFQNFGGTGIQGTQKMCWQITIGPFDCRSFLTAIDYDSLPVSSSSVYPQNAGPDRPAYTKLGSFYGMNRSQALGE